MRVSIITPTCDRPAGIALAEKYMARQTVQPFEWIIADSGRTAAQLTLGQIHILQPLPPGARNLSANLVAALERVTGDAVVIVEDDDHYDPVHIEACVAGLRRQAVHGAAELRYFNVQHRCWIKMRNVGAALCQTAFRIELVPEMLAAAREAYAGDDFGIDRRFWCKRQKLAKAPQTVTGIKGLPGTAGLGIGHRPTMNPARLWKPDPHMFQLQRWIGKDVENYRCF